MTKVNAPYLSAEMYFTDTQFSCAPGWQGLNKRHLRHGATIVTALQWIHEICTVIFKISPGYINIYFKKFEQCI